MLEAATNECISSSASATGTSIGAAMLFDSKDAEITDSEPHRSNALLVDALQAYVTRWKASVRAGTDDAFNN